jgi:hypothetical protein
MRRGRLLTLALLAALIPACGEQSAEDPPLAPSLNGAQLEIETVPSRWRLGSPGFSVRVTYRMAPPNAGLMVWVGRDRTSRGTIRLPESGGGLTMAPIPIEGDGVKEVWFEGKAFSAPADVPSLGVLRPGRHVFTASMFNHRSGVIGMVIPPENAATLARARSPAIMIQAPCRWLCI